MESNSPTAPSATDDYLVFTFNDKGYVDISNVNGEVHFAPIQQIPYKVMSSTKMEWVFSASVKEELTYSLTANELYMQGVNYYYRLVRHEQESVSMGFYCDGPMGEFNMSLKRLEANPSVYELRAYVYRADEGLLANFSLYEPPSSSKTLVGPVALFEEASILIGFLSAEDLLQFSKLRISAYNEPQEVAPGGTISVDFRQNVCELPNPLD